MQGLQRLKKRQWAFDPCQDCIDATEKYLKGNDPFTRFVNDHVVIQKEAGENLTILKDHLFLKFNEWLDDQDMVAPRIDIHNIQSKAGYGTKLGKLMEDRNIYFDQGKVTIDGKRQYRYKGIDCHYGNVETDQFDF